ncbi:CASP8-associated protein 2 [Trichomycterus rosablanca]|uniref:CASP8-associated protein 2 n=1 Tax=Trichomycterus rosablanca TaxID=2290929 RepID=UPI002F351A5A
MEMSAIDELYGDLDQDRYDSGLNYDEDSVDIYSGLEGSPKNNRGSGKEQTFFSPQRLRESMDLYEELITKEQVEKDATYSELKSKFDAAQNQVQELLAKLQQIQTKNSSLHKENTLLKKNICALIKTAKMEIVRKDEEISKLSKRSNRGIFHISALDRYQNSNNVSGLLRGSQDFRGDERTKWVNKPDESAAGKTQRCTRSNTESTLKRHEMYLSSVPHKHSQSEQTSQIKDRVNTGSETAPEITRIRKDGRDGGKEYLTTHSNSLASDLKEKDILEKPQTNTHNNRPKKAQNERTTRSASSKVQHQQDDDPVLPRRSGRSRSPVSQTQLTSSSRSDSQSSKGPSRTDTETLDRKEDFQHKQREEKQSGKLETSANIKGSIAESGSSLDRATENKGNRDHHRKEERRQEDTSISERRHTRSDGMKQSEPKKMQESEGRIKQSGSSSRGDKRSTSSDTRKEHERRSAKESDRDSKMPKEVSERQTKEGRDRSRGDVPVSNQNASPVKTDQRKDHNKRKKSSKIEEELSRSKASSSRDDTRDAKSSTAEQLSRSKVPSSRNESRGAKSSTEDQLHRSKFSSSPDSSRGVEGSTEEQLSRSKDSSSSDGSKSGKSSTGDQSSRSKDFSISDGLRGAGSSTEEQVSRSKASSSRNDSKSVESYTEKQLCRSKSSSNRDGSRSGKSSTEKQLPRTISSSSRDDSRGAESSAAHARHSTTVEHSAKDKGASTDSEKGRSKSDRCSKKSMRSSSSEKSKTVKDSHVSESCQTDRQSTKRKSSGTLTSSSDMPTMPEEGSPNRKLSFMETLNLTLSPVKNQNLHTLKEPGKPDEALVSNSFEDQVSFELGEEFCVIDEAENCQESIDAMEDSAVTTAGALPLEHSNTSIQCNQGQDVPTGSTEPEPSICQDVKVNEKDLEVLNSLDGDMSAKAKTLSMDSEMQEMEFITKGNDLNKSATGICPTLPQSVVNNTVVAEAPLTEESEPADRPVPLGNLCQEQDPILVWNQQEEQTTGSRNTSEENLVDNNPESNSAPSVQSDMFGQEVSISVEVDATSETCSIVDSSASLEVVSSTIGVDVNPQSKAACTDKPTVMNMNISRDLEKPIEPLERSLAETLSVGTTIREDKIPSEQASSSEPDSTEDEMNNSKPSGSVVVQHDEDSMMLTLSNIKVIPEAISPLTSPVRQIKKVQPQCLGNEQHVKCLSKDFSTCTTDKTATKMDMNKENKRPLSPVMPSTLEDQQEALTSTATQEALEEGEIISESDEERALVIQSPPVRKRSSSRIQSSPKSPILKKTNQIKTAVTPNHCEQGKNTTPTSTDSPTSSKRRFKTVTVPSKAAISSTVEFMNTLSYIRSELRRKYMKLHRNVTKTAFCGIIDMSLASFTEFVDTVNFHKFCSQEKEIKPRVNKIIANVMSKVSNNGIVNRIFEQRADDLKQKLWNFVDGQFDFLFKEVKAALKSVSDHSRFKTSNPRETEDLTPAVCKIQRKEPLSMAENIPHTNQTTTLHSLPFKGRGLGSSGKNIKATMEDGAKLPDEQASAVLSLEKYIPETAPVQEQTPTFARRLSHNASIQDRSDFEILTEQQASSLTFNLVTDSQMGDIFRCLLQGSDLLEASVSLGDNQNWPLNTPRKEGMSAESLIGVMTPSKIVTPLKLGMTWAPVSPYKFTSPNSKFQMSVNPALLDESCLLEVPSNALPNQALPAFTSVNSHKSYSILADDLAVSLTIPSPLKSDDHLSFLNPANVKMLSTPSNIISAHYSEDALLDGEDATEQDIHLSLDTDNSSCTSSTGGAWEAQNSAVFQVKPNLPMQAEVMERSNDHFIVRIRHAGVHGEPTQEAESKAVCQEDKASAFPGSATSMAAQPLATSNCQSEAQISINHLFNGDFEGDDSANLPQTCENQAEQATVDPNATRDTASTDPAISLTSADGKTTSATESEDNVFDGLPECHKKTRKRKKHHSGSKAKRSRRERSQDGHEKERHKKRSKSSKEKSHKTHSKKIPSPSPQLSPNSLSAKNIIRKKGEVVVTWTREEDRDILVALKLKGPSSKTFAALSSKLRKSQGQIEERFNQLMKLFKKKEKLES